MSTTAGSTTTGSTTTVSPTAGSTTGALSSGGLRTGGFPTTRVPPPTDIDRPDGPPPTPDARLGPAALRELLRTKANGSGTCSAEGLRVQSGDVDAALGHRYTTIRATNISQQSCTLAGYPGLGFRGEWGTPFGVVAERREIPLTGLGNEQPDQQLRLEPGEVAVAALEWTGSLAGAYDEKASLLVLQATRGGQPIGVSLVADKPDLGAGTSVYIDSWKSAQPERN
ncbi:DUF4232 domain-containing protein [Nakamurella aerolata]|uniref:DUF4232 domain-containing protein n=1 Tax=Nakamurella aerolata TaxID=1656892 RepID=A0A849A2H1_9ACTN|nr:DUF4232 domain-containing protein [Nakamurella aerolata]